MFAVLTGLYSHSRRSINQSTNHVDLPTYICDIFSFNNNNNNTRHLAGYQKSQ